MRRFFQRILCFFLQRAFIYGLSEGLDFAQKYGYPIKIEPSFTLHGAGCGVARNEEELRSVLREALRLSPVHEVFLKRV